ncbi:MAG: hypothetical protein IJZ23_09785 [Roseburia sp.]|nr:hypothetical protein [Roseburia sp.]
MDLSPVFLMKFKNTVERILHVRGNYNGGILEMAVVLDHNVSRECVQELVPQLFRSLKMHSEVFRNVRLNMVDWEADEVLRNQVTPMSMAGLASFYEDYVCRPKCKDFRKLVQYLKVFQARAKLIILVTDGANEEGSSESLKAAMQPFLDKKLMQVVVGDELQIRYR